MKKKLIIISLFAACIIASAHGMHHKKHHHHHDHHTVGHKHIVFDLEDVLIEPNISTVLHTIGAMGTATILKNIGFSGFLHAAWNRATPSTEDILKEFFTILKPIDYCNASKHDKRMYNAAQLTYKGLKAPKLIRQWLLAGNTINCAQIEQHALAGIDQQDIGTHQKDLAKKLATLTFNPEQNAESVKIIPDALALLQELREHNNTVYLVTHWNHEALHTLQFKQPELFECIGTHIITSGEERAPKPKLAHTCITRFNLDRKHTFFVESDPAQLEHSRIFDNKTARGIVCAGNYPEIRTALQKFKALPSES